MKRALWAAIIACGATAVAASIAAFATAPTRDDDFTIDEDLIIYRTEIREYSIPIHESDLTHIGLQLSSDDSVLVTTIDQQSLTEELVQENDWTDIAFKNVWRLQPGGGAAEVVNEPAWDVDKEGHLLYLIADPRPARRHRLSSQLNEAVPSWWPKDESVGKGDRPVYRYAVPAHDAFYYQLLGKRINQTTDIWGDVSQFNGPLRPVLRDLSTDDLRLAVFELETTKPYYSVNTLLSSDGMHAIVYTSARDRIWIVRLADAWKAFDDGRDR